MQGDPEVIETLNQILTAELTAVNQYYVHAKMCQNWGYQRLAAHHRHESVEEMKHADELIERILYFDGVPNMQRLNPIRIGENVLEQHEVDLALEMEAVARLNEAISLCRNKNDNGTREILEKMLRQEEEAVDWTEAQISIIREIGKENYLAEQLRE
jgi:bacterioferritin